MPLTSRETYLAMASERPVPPDASAYQEMEAAFKILLDGDHWTAYKRAIENVLATEIAESTYAQIADGLPTIACWEEFNIPMKSHPIYQLNHTTLCEGVLELLRSFRTALDLGQLPFRKQLLQAFMAAAVGSHKFNLRLIELAAVACHTIAARLYQLDAGPHKHQVHQDWYASEKQIQTLTGKVLAMPLPRVPYRHRSYGAADQYPEGVADMVGYWAEARIMGGVAVFDRGETDLECKAVYFHGGRRRSPRTLYPPTEEQFQALVSFLKRSPIVPDDNGPLPILASHLNRYRWDPYYAMKDYHIFRDRYERVLLESNKSNWRWTSNDWPEYADEHFILLEGDGPRQGKPPNEEGVKAAYERLKQITPTSPFWRPETQEEEGQMSAD